jgi:hypothetical protein
MNLRNHVLRLWTVLILFEMGTNDLLSSALIFLEKARTFLKLCREIQLLQKNCAVHLIKWQKDERVAN